MSDARPGEAIVTFSDGLPGFEASRQFMLVTSPALDPFTLIQGVGPGAPSFLAIDPHRVEHDFAAPLAPADSIRLKRDPEEPLLWLALVTADTAGKATVNLRAPLVINPAAMIGIQMVAGESRYRFDHPLSST